MTNRLPIVWHATPLPERHRLDLLPLRGFGELRHVFGAWPSTASTDDDHARFREDLDAFLDEFDESQDFLVHLPTDDAAGLLLIGSSLYQLPRVQWLRWDRRTDTDGQRLAVGYYVPREVRPYDL